MSTYSEVSNTYRYYNNNQPTILFCQIKKRLQRIAYIRIDKAKKLLRIAKS